ncbi:caspase, EACC1-associated type [Streptomyces sp. MMS24-I2-30]|uniref:caspase, EACC1-associated type n=1 Tax=Streptomyces sp. MMS24-I2-30 TaxID=3351564 RepID=UPI003896CC07
MSPDRSRSRAILIGTSHYRDPAMRPLPADTCVSAMAALLSGDLCGWPAERVTPIEDMDSPRDAVLELVPLVRDVTDVLLVYYVGHGMRTRDGQLALAMTGTVPDPEVLPDSALPYPRLVEVLSGSPAATKLVILDCCHAELGMDADFHFQSGSAAELADAHPVDGLYFIGASSRYQKAKSPIGGRLTHFTHTFIDVVEKGIPHKPAELNLRQIFVETRSRLLRAGLPQPVDGGVRDAYQFPFARNAAFHALPGAASEPAPPLPGPATTGPSATRPSATEPSGLRRPSRRALLLAAAGVTVAATAVPLGLSLLSSAGGEAAGKESGGKDGEGAGPEPTPYATVRQPGVMDAAFSPDSKTLATGNGDGTISLWDVAARRRTAVLTDFTGPAFNGVVSVAFSPNGAFLAGVDSKEAGGDSARDGTISLWEVATRKRLATLADEGVVLVNQVAFSPAGAILASANGIGTISIWSVAAQAKIATLTSAVAGVHTSTKQVNSIAFSPDGSILAASTVAGLVELWDGATYTKIATIAGSETGVGALAFSPDGKLLAGATAGSVVHLWEVAGHKEIAVLTYTDSPDEGLAAGVVGSLAFSPDGRFLAGGTQAGLLLFWDVATRKAAGRLGRFTSSGGSDTVGVAFSPDGKALAASLLGKVALWKLPGGGA